MTSSTEASPPMSPMRRKTRRTSRSGETSSEYMSETSMASRCALPVPWQQSTLSPRTRTPPRTRAACSGGPSLRSVRRPRRADRTPRSAHELGTLRGSPADSSHLGHRFHGQPITDSRPAITVGAKRRWLCAFVPVTLSGLIAMKRRRLAARATVVRGDYTAPPSRAAGGHGETESGYHLTMRASARDGRSP